MLSSSSKASKGGKVLVCGMKGVGKTALIEQLIYGNITIESDIHSTIEDIYMANVDTGRGPREQLRIYDTAGLQGKAQLPRHYLVFPDGYVLVYDPSDPSSLDMLDDIKSDIDKNKEKKEVAVIVLGNVRSGTGTLKRTDTPPTMPDPIEAVLSRANSWCARERIKHYTVNAMERDSIFEPFVQLCIRLHPIQPKSSFPQLRQVMQKRDRSDA
ncbi:NF-kappa-B inhibitor-interacting Ras-like protein [Episyrphus balteatus]|uniref:NF-kappa-B inhibitor-interacting Ras-like protein n=1 Tax=Episyrphus balteatus TaxID=286459 RepID=UPI002486C0F6|nr:NF-kappa-B inhibitor-interacting Ras-like protein [Episyrphus balteatus]